MIMGIASMFIGMQQSNEERKKCILDEWNKSKDYPRKLKKKVRKRLKIDYNIASIDLFSF